MVLMLSVLCLTFFFFKQKTAYEMRISDWSSDVCSSDLMLAQYGANPFNLAEAEGRITLIEADIGAEGAIDAAVGQAAVIFNLAGHTSHMDSMQQIGRASCRERVCQYV